MVDRPSSLEIDQALTLTGGKSGNIGLVSGFPLKCEGLSSTSSRILVASCEVLQQASQTEIEYQARLISTGLKAQEEDILAKNTRNSFKYLGSWFIATAGWTVGIYLAASEFRRRRAVNT